MKDWLKILIPAIMLVFLVGSVTAYNGQTIEKRSYSVQEDGTPQVFTLTPSQDNYINLEKVQLIVWSKNHTTLIVHDTKKVGSGPKYFRIEVDLQNKTYKTTKLEITKEKFPELFGKIETSSGTTLQETNRISSPTILSTTYYYGRVSVLTEDPINIDCAKTTHRLDWSTDGTTVNFISRELTATAYTTIVGTHWYIDYAQFNGPVTYSSSHDSVTSDAEAQYYNDDWHNDDERTWAWHRIRITGKANGYFDWTAWWDHWGEDAWLLHGSAFVE